MVKIMVEIPDEELRELVKEKLAERIVMDIRGRKECTDKRDGVSKELEDMMG